MKQVEKLEQPDLKPGKALCLASEECIEEIQETAICNETNKEYVSKQILKFKCKKSGRLRRKELVHTGKGKTQQAHRNMCDVNVLMKKYGRAKDIPGNVRAEVYGDFTQVGDYHNSLEIVQKAKAQFDMLPAETRKKFDNDPSKMLDFCQNPANVKEMVELGLAVRQEDAAPVEVKVTNQQAAPGKDQDDQK